MLHSKFLNSLNNDSKIQLIFNIVCFVLTVILWIFVLIYIPRGFDLSDNGYYLLHYIHYEDVTITLPEFGAINKIIYILAGQSVAQTRLLGGILMLSASSLAGIFLINHVAKNVGDMDIFRLQHLIIHPYFGLICLFVSGGVMYYARWLTTPSYNWSTLIGLLLFWSGTLLWLDVTSVKRSAIGAGLVGLAAGLVFWSRPTVASVLPLLLLSLLLINFGKVRYLFRRISIFLGIIGLTSALAIPSFQGSSPSDTLQKFELSIQYQSILRRDSQSEHDDLLHEPFPKTLDLIRVSIGRIPIESVLVIFLTGLSSFIIGRFRNSRLFIQLVLSIVWCGTVANLVVNTWQWGLSVFFLTIYTLFILHLTHILSSRRTRQRAQRIKFRLIGLASLLIISAIIYSFGTDNSYLQHTQFSSIFFIFSVGILLLAFPVPMTGLLRLIIPSSLILSVIFLMIQTSFQPYRQKSPTTQMNTVVSLRNNQETVIVGSQMAEYIIQLQNHAKEAGFAENTPIIDMTGHSPGSVYVLNGRAMGAPWLLGGWDGSEAAAFFVLSQWDRNDLERAWIMTAEENVVRALSLDILDDLGLDFPNNYVNVGEMVLPFFDETHALWKPITP